MTDSYIHRKLKEEFKTHPIFTRNELLDFFRHYLPELNEGSLTWRIFDLKKRNIIKNLRKGVYTLNSRQVFEPTPNNNIISISKLIEKQYGPHVYNIWDTSWLNEFVELQAITSMVVLEIEKHDIDSVFFTLKDNGFPEVFTKPDENLVEKYISEAKQPVIIKPFLSRSPVQLIQRVAIPSLEKILVDIYCDKKIYYAFQGHQLINIYRNATMKYSLNFSRLFNYAKRRSREDEIKRHLLEVLDKDLKNAIA